MPFHPTGPARARLDHYLAFAAHRHARVLLAEDDDELRRLLCNVLRRDGFEVVEARDGLQLTELLDSQLLHVSGRPAVDLVISDVRMPGCTGLQVLAHLRRADWATPVILITAFGDRETHEEALRLGATAVLDKPVDLDDLRTAALNLVRPPS